MAEIQYKGGGGGTNSAYDQFSRMEQDRRSNTYSDIAVQNADIAQQRAGREAEEYGQGRAVDRALSGELANTATGRNASMVRTLAKTGAGRQAAQVYQQDQRDTDDMERKALTAAATGDEPTYQFFKKKAGLVIPPEVDRDVKARAVYARGGLIAERLYRNDPQKAYRFVTEFMTDGDMTRALNATGAPSDKPHWTATQLEMEGKRVIGLLDTISGRVMVPKGPDGQPLQSGVGYAGRHAGGGSGKVAYIQYLTGIGLSPAEAVQVANAPVQSPERAWQDTYNRLLTKLVTIHGPDEAQRLAREAADQSAEMVRSSPLYRIGKDPAQPDPGGQPQPYTPSAGPPPPRPNAPTGPASQNFQANVMIDGVSGSFSGQTDERGLPIYVTPQGQRFVVEE